jgi:hypothetical protein
MNNHELHGKKIEVVQFVNHTKRQPGESKFNNLYVKNIPTGTTDEKL